MNKYLLWIIIILGLFLQIWLSRHSPGTPQSIWYMVGTITLFIGCAGLAEQKGYSRNYGFLAILSLIGVIILALMPRRIDPNASSSAR